MFSTACAQARAYLINFPSTFHVQGDTEKRSGGMRGNKGEVGGESPREVKEKKSRKRKKKSTSKAEGRNSYRRGRTIKYRKSSVRRPGKREDVMPRNPRRAGRMELRHDEVEGREGGRERRNPH
jgi:hypothetical protein